MGETTYRVEIVVPDDADSDRAGETVEITVGEDEYVLAAAGDRRLRLPADCQQGWCTTCGAELLEGEGDQSDAKRYYESDEEAGLICRVPRNPVRTSDCGPIDSPRC